MRRLLPSRVELAIFAILAVVSACVVTLIQSGSHDLALAALAMPMFLVAAVMGLRKSPVWMATAADEAGDDAVVE